MAIGDTLPVLLQKIADVDIALHELITQGATQELRHGDKSIRTTNPTVAELQAYRAQLVGEANALGAGLAGGRAAARRVIF